MPLRHGVRYISLTPVMGPVQSLSPTSAVSTINDNQRSDRTEERTNGEEMGAGWVLRRGGEEVYWCGPLWLWVTFYGIHYTCMYIYPLSTRLTRPFHHTASHLLPDPVYLSTSTRHVKIFSRAAYPLPAPWGCKRSRGHGTCKSNVVHRFLNVVFVLGLVSLINSLTSGNKDLPH